MAAVLEPKCRISDLGRSRQAQVLRLGDAALPVGGAAHGPRAQLRDRRRPSSLQAHAGIPRPASHGLGLVRPASRKRRHQEQTRPALVDPREHRGHEAAAKHVRLQLRLGLRNVQLRAGLLSLEPVVLPAHVGERPRLSQAGHCELVPRLRHSAGQRAGRRRLLLAPRRHASRVARARPVVLPYDRLLGRTAPIVGRAGRRVARARVDDAAQLDRSLRRHGGGFLRQGHRPADSRVHDAG